MHNQTESAGLNRREFVGSLALSAAATMLGATTVPGKDAPKRNDWFLKNPRVFLIDSQMPDPLDQGAPGMPERFFEKLDTRLIVDQVAAAGADTLLVHAKDNQGNCYYDSKLAHKHSSLGARDLMREYTEHSRKKGLTLLYYVQLSRERRSFAEHPENQARDAQGNGIRKITKNPMRVTQEDCPVVCMNGPHGEFTRQVLRELAASYDFDGFWLDCFTWWGKVPVCYCDSCRAAYKRDTGFDLPASSKELTLTKEGKTYFHWRQALNTKIMHSLMAAIQDTNPRLTVTHNASAVAEYYDWAFCGRDTYVSHEFHYNEGQANLSLLCRRQQALKRGVPFEIEIWRFANRLGSQYATSRDYQVRTVSALLLEMATVAAHGGFSQYYDQINPDGTLDRKSLARLAPAFGAIQQRTDWIAQGQPLPYAALLWSKNTEALATLDARQMYADDLEGFHHALIESHLPVNFLTEPELENRAFNGARVIVLPSVECLSDACIANLKTFVQAGGGLVVTGRTSLANGKGEPRANFGLADLLGVDYADMTHHYYTYLSPDQDHPAVAGLTVGFPLSTYETRQALIRPRPGTDVLGEIIDPLPGFHMGYPPHKRTGFAGLTVRKFGQGRVVYLAGAQGAIYRRFNHPDQKQLLASAIAWAAGEPAPLRVEAPSTLEVIPWRDEAKKQTIIHLINRTSAGPAQNQPGALIHETIPLHQVVLHLHQSIGGKEATLVPGKQKLPLRHEGDWSTLTIDRIDEWATVVLS